MVVLLYVGRFAPEKNLHILGETVDRLGRDYVLVVQGAGPCPPHGERVVRLPYCSHPDTIAQALASADVFVHAGTRETFGLAPLEALACGTPVVLPARAGFLDLIDAARCQWVPAQARRSCWPKQFVHCERLSLPSSGRRRGSLPKPLASTARSRGSSNATPPCCA